MKSRQFCSVCKEWLEMEVVPTSDGEEDDGVIWFRCPQCQGFLPKLGGLEPESVKETSASPAVSSTSAEETEDSKETGETGEALPWDSPADMMAAREKTSDDSSPADSKDSRKDEPAEPVHEYAALLAEKDQSDPTPYRPWESYEVGQCVHHQAWEDCGVVVAKEDLPGGRQIIKCYFKEAGVVRLIEQAPK
ncbi:MAG: hypothetical protein KAH56_02260 [Candidatus Krumholzibacteria bacterium]|nr:hypothetical protein [Candidatus Krumholzibacteria bacterium]